MNTPGKKKLTPSDKRRAAMRRFKQRNHAVLCQSMATWDKVKDQVFAGTPRGHYAMNGKPNGGLAYDVVVDGKPMVAVVYTELGVSRVPAGTRYLVHLRTRSALKKHWHLVKEV